MKGIHKGEKHKGFLTIRRNHKVFFELRGGHEGNIKEFID